MDELQIARSKAEILHKLRYWGESDHGSVTESRWESYGRLDSERLQLEKLETMTYELAKSRASATTRDFDSVLRETELEVMVQLARILAGTIDPVLEASTKVVIEEDGEVCGVCLEEMAGGDEARAVGCKHKFHGFCIVQWLQRSNVCPLCRYRPMQCNNVN